MQLFLAVCRAGGVDPGALTGSLGSASARIPHLAQDTLETWTSPSGRTALAAVAHPPALAAPRRYRAITPREALVYDGFPVAPGHGVDALDAASLLAHWARLPALLEGQFAVLRAVLAEDRFEVLSDPLGLSPLYVAQLADGAAVANSVAALVAVTGRRAPDPVGVSGFLAAGYAPTGHTLIDGIAPVPGGAVLELEPERTRLRRHWAPEVTPPAARGPREPPAAFVGGMEALVRAAAESGAQPLRLAVTAGRDSRAVLALLRRTPRAAEVDYGTMGTPEDVDVRIARHVARELGLRHRVVEATPLGLAEDPVELIRTFVALTDGMTNLWQIADLGGLADPLERVGLQFQGTGGEIARPGRGRVTMFAPRVPVLRGSRRFQARALRVGHGALLTPAGHAHHDAHLDRFVTQRREEGWRTRELTEAHLVLERVPRTTAAGLRRASPRNDLFSPLCARRFVDHALAQTPSERLVETSHSLLLSVEPRLRDLPYERPRPRPSPRFAPVILASVGARSARERVSGRPAMGPPAPPAFGARWLHAHRALHREHVHAVGASPLWEIVDRAAVERGLARDEILSKPDAGALLAALTLLWTFHPPQ